ncbi:hypothetical protein VVD49_11425 [Uliginosibacterium sp. H3]|uniref:Uncharacterized protein n=1 Tax=Uliginosibacterium silvisoli TaxID=3114758 RepID=A0ABU6K4I3_9RHOO|nr:hypothetical protein [Uliginosibacterium sp. H3]
MAQRYKIVFQGELLAGFDPIQVRADAARLLNAQPSQISQLFSGRPVGIRNNLSAAEAARYQSSLSSIGLRVRALASTTDNNTASKPAKSQASFRITYSGGVLPGLSRESVMQRVMHKLRLDEARLARLFCGKPAILKKGLDAIAAARYLAEATQLGMLANMEPEPPTKEIAPHTPAGTGQRFMQSAVKTQLYSPRAPLYDDGRRSAEFSEVRTNVDIDLMRALAEEPVGQSKQAAAEEPLPQVRLWRPPAPEQAVTAETTPALATPAAIAQTPELALGSIALHMPTNTSADMQVSPAPRRKPALQRLAEMGSLLPRALSRILQ